MRPTVLVSLASFLLSCLFASTNAFGGSNVFGLFRKRRLRLEEVQAKREAEAEALGFAGPHGSPLSGEEAAKQAKKKTAAFDPLLNWFRKNS